MMQRYVSLKIDLPHEGKGKGAKTGREGKE
jgi:hypothetical protein